jgi:ferredoxin
MRVCPTQVIQPAGVGAGLESLWTPKLSPRPGYCEYNCDLCGRACPSGAIPPFTLPEKHAVAMGLAYVDTTRCIPWRGYQRSDEEGLVVDEHNCGVCEEVCPAPGKAIHFGRFYLNGQELRLPHVRPEACVGCGYCEAACPLQGKAAIRVTGGFRELPPRDEAVAVGVLVTEAALPAEAGGMRLAGPKVTYEGADDLFDYINGGAEPYLTFNFVRATTANYTDGETTVKADLWEFETNDDAFGAFAKDRQGDPAEIGDEGAVRGSSLWARRGRYTLTILDLGDTPPVQVRLLAEAVLDALDGEPAPWPTICRRLPADGLDPMSVVFMRDETPLFSIRLAERYISDSTWGFAEGMVGAYGGYALRDDGKNVGLVLIQHGDGAAAAEAVARLAALRSEWGEEQVQAEPCVVFKAGEGDFCAIGSGERYFAAVFSAPTAEAGTTLVRQALE